MAAVVTAGIKSSIPGACKVFKITDTTFGTDLQGTNSGVLTSTKFTGFSPMDLTAPLWQASTAYIVGQLIQDSNGNFQRCTTAGTSGATAPTWALSSTTSDSGVTWTFYAAYRAPQFNNTIPDPYQVRLRAFCTTASRAITAAATLDVLSWYLDLTDTTQTTIVCTILVGVGTAGVIVEVPAE